MIYMKVSAIQIANLLTKLDALQNTKLKKKIHRDDWLIVDKLPMPCYLLTFVIVAK